jgi:hypothetical protein
MTDQVLSSRMSHQVAAKPVCTNGSSGTIKIVVDGGRVVCTGKP